MRRCSRETIHHKRRKQGRTVGRTSAFDGRQIPGRSFPQNGPDPCGSERSGAIPAGLEGFTEEETRIRPRHRIPAARRPAAVAAARRPAGHICRP